jgi:tetratricopeptide (TPR) repeat protein
VAPVLPLLVVFCAFGWKSLLSPFSPKRVFPWVIFFVAVFGGLDAYHLFGPYHQLWRDPENWRGYSKSIERYRAHFILDQTAAEKGPGFIFTSFVPGLCDRSLNLVDNAYNVSENPALPPQTATWAALLTNVNNQPFLARRFPQGRAFALSDHLNRSDGGFILWQMPITPENREALGRWQKASEAFTCLPSAGPQETLDSFFPAYPAFRGDPFLESFFWEKMSDLYFTASNFKDYQKPIEALNMALSRGDRAAHLYLKLGVFYLMENDFSAARKAFQGALKAPGNQTQAKTYLEALPPLGSGL